MLISNDVAMLSTVMARVGEAPEVVLEATYGWYWAVDALRVLNRRAGASATSVGNQGIRASTGEERRKRR